MTDMKAIDVAAYGGPEQLKLVDKPRPESGLKRLVRSKTP